MKKLISTLLIGLASCILSLTSCKKEQDTTNPPASPEYYVKFKLDGVQNEYFHETSAVFTTYAGVYSSSMIGARGPGTIREAIRVEFSSDVEIAANVTYRDTIVPTLGIPAAYLVYADENGAAFSSWVAVSPGVKAVITQMDDSTVTGTFSGVVLNTQDLTTSHTVTAGQFHLPRS